MSGLFSALKKKKDKKDKGKRELPPTPDDKLYHGLVDENDSNNVYEVLMPTSVGGETHYVNTAGQPSDSTYVNDPARQNEVYVNTSGRPGSGTYENEDNMYEQPTTKPLKESKEGPGHFTPIKTLINELQPEEEYDDIEIRRGRQACQTEDIAKRISQLREAGTYKKEGASAPESQPGTKNTGPAPSPNRGSKTDSGFVSKFKEHYDIKSGGQAPKTTRTVDKKRYRDIIASGPFVAAIDIGNAYSGYAFSCQTDYQRNPQQITSNELWGTTSLQTQKVPTVLLFRADGTFDSFGYDAQTKFADAQTGSEFGGYWRYVHNFKTRLFNSKNLGQKSTIEDTKKRPISALLVFSTLIRCLKDHLIEAVSDVTPGATNSNIHWVLTHPDVSGEAGKKFLQEAANQAGIDNRQLTITAESEATVVYCKEMRDTKQISFRPGYTFIIMDVGADLTKLTAYEIPLSGGLSPLQTFSGAWGGVTVDQEFEKMILKLFGTDNFRQFTLKDPKAKLEMDQRFEKFKRSLRTDKEGCHKLKLPASVHKNVKDVTKNITKAGYDDKINVTGDELSIDAGIIKRYVETTVDCIVTGLQGFLKDSHVAQITTIYGVGGFLESSFVRQRMVEAFPSKTFVFTKDPNRAVMFGGVLYGYRAKLF